LKKYPSLSFYAPIEHYLGKKKKCVACKCKKRRTVVEKKRRHT
jgi:hypothetical protein